MKNEALVIVREEDKEFMMQLRRQSAQDLKFQIFRNFFYILYIEGVG